MCLVQEPCIIYAAAELVMLVVLGPQSASCSMQAGGQLQADSAAAESHRLLLVMVLLVLQIRDGTVWR
jgi:hypothetical protein